jgi:excinuclease ABC subunit C
MRERLRRVPKSPGVYVFKGTGERVLYVGKAKDLRMRLRSYFRKSASLDRRKQAMVRDVRDFSTIVTSGELEALALEANLIKQYRPRFNVILRDDKNYPYLKLTLDETWPCLEIVRRPARDKAMYFGPYVMSSSMYEALRFIKRNFGIRPCRYRLDTRKPGRPCIQHQMGRCPAPCAGLVSPGQYAASVDEVISFLKGKRTELLDSLKAEMEGHSERQEYEKAAEARDRIAALGRAWESQKVIAPELGDLDVVGLHIPESIRREEASEEGRAAAGRRMRGIMAVVLFVRSGTMIGAREFLIRNVEGAPVPEILREFLMNFYSKGLLPPHEVLLPEEPEDAEGIAAWLMEQGARVSLKVPRRGKKRDLVAMAGDNALAAFEARRAGTGPEETIEELSVRLGLSSSPRSIGAFDISNLTGSDPVGAYVFWEEGHFLKDSYRHVRIKEVEGIDDYAMMRETIKRVFRDRDLLPDLVVIDGAAGHLGVALDALSELGVAIPAIGVAKKPDRAFIQGAGEPVPISGREASSVLLRQVRDEVHRFGVGFHKRLRGKRLMESPLEGIPGIGKKRRLALLREFGSLEGIRNATLEELASAEGMNTRAASAVREAFRESSGNDDERN